MGYPRHGIGNLSAALVPADVFIQTQSSLMVGRMARSDPGGNPKCAPFAGIGHQRHAQAHCPLATRTLGGNTDFSFCTENEIPGRYRRHWNGAILAGKECDLI